MGVVGALQSAGAAGLALSSQILIGTAVGATAAGVSGAAFDQVPTEEGTRSGGVGGNGNDAGGGAPRGGGDNGNDANGSAPGGEGRQDNDAEGSARGEGRQNNNAEGSARGEGRQDNEKAEKSDVGDNGTEREHPMGNIQWEREEDLEAEHQERSQAEGRSGVSGVDSTENDPSGNILEGNRSLIFQNVEIRIAPTETGLPASETGLTTSEDDLSASGINSPASLSIGYGWREDPDGPLSLQWSDVDRHLP